MNTSVARRAGLGVRFGQRDQRGDPGGVVDRAVADVVAGRVRGAAPEMVPVRGVQHVLVGPLASRQHADHVLRGEPAGSALSNPVERGHLRADLGGTPGCPAAATSCAKVLARRAGDLLGDRLLAPSR
jgi:hypothetical protein